MTAPTEGEALFKCKLCRSTLIARRYELARPWKNTDPYVAVICGGCGLFQDLYDWELAVKAQQSERLNMLYREEHELWDSDVELEANIAKSAGFAEQLDRLGMIRGKRILEVGCGKGLFLRRCMELGAAQVTGQEFFTKGAVDFARRQLGIGDLRVSGFDDTESWPDAEFDVVCSFDVAEHVHDLREFFVQCLRVSKPGGLQYHATPGSGSLSNLLGRSLVGPLAAIGGKPARDLGTSLCNLQPDLDHRGGAHVSLLDIAQVRWLADTLGMSLRHTEYVSSYTYSNRHYAALIPGLRHLPPSLGAGIFAGVRRLVRNKLVFSAVVAEGETTAA